MSKEEFQKTINNFASNGIPFIFLVDFEMKQFIVSSLKNAKRNGLSYDIKGNSNFEYSNSIKESKIVAAKTIDKKKYKKAFDLVQKNIIHGNSYLLNLTFPTEIKTGSSLKSIFNSSKAPYKLLYKDDFTLFSPECFIKIKGNHIFSYPMKGTIDATIPNAKEVLLNDKKELNEHFTIVDLIRNDLSMVSKNVIVTKFRYMDVIKAKDKQLLQASSEIRGTLDKNWRNNLGDIIIKLLPAGSISGAPKRKTVEIIKQAERQKRGFYTGIFGIFDGKNLDSAVNIRFIEKVKDSFFYRSGGGITAQSDMNFEYEELKQKVYVPIS